MSTLVYSVDRPHACVQRARGQLTRSEEVESRCRRTATDHTQRVQGVDLTWFALAKNLLNDDIRLSTSVLKDIAPLPGRRFVVGVRTKF